MHYLGGETMIQHTCCAKSIFVSLIDSIDTYNYLLKNHHRRTAVIAYQLGSIFGLPESNLCNLVLASSIHDIGALHIDERDKLLYIDAIDPGTHETVGAKMLESFSPLDPIRKIIFHHHIKVSDVENGIVPSEEVPIECYFLHLADRIDILMATKNEEQSKEYIFNEINKRFGSVFLPELKIPFNHMIVSDDFWRIVDSSTFQKLLYSTIDRCSCVIEDDDLEGLAGVFANVTDYRSNWTLSHSKSVSLLAYMIGTVHGLDEESCNMLKIAGLLHDIGKVAIPTELLESPTALESGEEKIMHSHAIYSSLILSKTPYLGKISRLAASHHEKRDTTGYPLHLSNKFFSTEIDILAYADIFSALSEDRPYRKAMTKTNMLDIMEDYSHQKLSANVFSTIRDNFDYLYSENLKVTKEVIHYA